MLIDDPESCYRAVKSRDRRFDGVFYTAVSSTGIYCRPSCPAITPQRRNVHFFRTAAAAQQSGFRACKRCRPDATPGSPEWDVVADTAGRAMRLIGDGVVEREGVEGLAARLGYTPRHLSRLLGRQLGAGPLALARAHRAQTARILIESTAMPFSEVAFAAGFASIRQFNDTVRDVYACTPTQLRERATPTPGRSGSIQLALAVRQPFDGARLFDFLRARAVPLVEETGPGWYSRTLRLPRGTGRLRLDLDETPADGRVRLSLVLADLRDLGPAVERTRRLLDADCDPEAVDALLGADPLLAPLVRQHPGLRVPGHVDGDELAVRAVLGQQVSVARARAMAADLAATHGEPLDDGGRLFPSAVTLAELDPGDLPMPRVRARALVTLCRALSQGDVRLDRGADRDEVRDSLLAVPGIGPWTAGYVAQRALGDPDVFLAGDVGVRVGLGTLGVDPGETVALTERWRPWRSYAQMHLWTLAASSPRSAPRTPGARRERK